MPNPESQPYDYDEVTRLRLLLNQAEIQRDAFKAALNTEVLKVMRVSVIQATIDADNENARLKAEVERLTALVESNLNSSKVAMGKADAVLHERDCLKAEVERLTNLKSGADYFKAKEGEQS